MDQSQFTFIDCQRPLFLRNQVLQTFPVSAVLDWHHIWWHASTYHALWHTSGFVDADIYGFSLYVDGSAHRSLDKGAAGAVLLAHTEDAICWGGFATTPCLGETTAPRAEATALLLALCWIHQLICAFPSNAWFEIAYDCTHTAAIAQGQQAATHNRDLHIVIRALVQWIEVRLRTNIQWRHVVGHSHEPWNEAADTICRHAIQTDSFTSSLQAFFDICSF